MNQFALFHFTIEKNNKVYQFIVQPGSPWEDIEEALKEFQENMLTLKEEAKKNEAASLVANSDTEKE
jgi:hypothetical protein